jgi:1-acyl-sn-glycerol-3-phosphate acyltransferase
MLLKPWRKASWVVTALSLWTWYEIGVVCIAGCIMHWFFCALIWPFDRNHRLRGRFFRNIAVTAMRLSPMWTAVRHGPIPKEIRGRSVVVSNHVSHLDTFLLAGLPWEMKWLSKRSVFNIPFIGWSMWLTGDIPVVRGSTASIAQAMQRCAAYLQREMPICIFPEGTRARSDAMLPFKDGAFRLAIEQGADILPLAVAGTQLGLPKHSWRFGFSRGVVMVGTPVSTAGMGISQVGALRDQVRQQISRMLDEIRPLSQL